MNLQTVDDLIETLQRLPAAARKRPIYLGAEREAQARSQYPSRAIVVEDLGPYTVLRAGRDG